jgi:dTMP kinase
MTARGLPPDRYDRLGPDFHARVAAGFRSIAANAPERCVVVPADGSADAVQARIQAILSPRLRP